MRYYSGQILFLFFLTFIIYGFFNGFFYFNTTAAERADLPTDIPELLRAPVQTMLPYKLVLTVNGFTVKEVASFVITGRILNTDHCWVTPASDLSSTDLALGWDFMADKRVIRQISFVQARRFLYLNPPETLYRYFPNKQIVDNKQFFSSFDNIHTIPANDGIRNILKSLHRNQIVTLKGALVYVSHPGLMDWNSSLSREDTGDGACEIMYVENVQIH